MSDDTADFDLRAIRELLLAAFTAEDLRRFLEDRRDLRPVVAEFGPGHGLTDMVDEVVTYCRTHSLWSEFLAAVREERPRTYVRFEPRLGVAAPSAYTPPRPPDPADLPEPGGLPPGSRLPFDRNHLFTGREAQLKALARALLHPPARSSAGGADAGATLITQAVQGMGGIGKTQLAVEFAYRYGRYFHGVYWLHCGQPEAIGAEIAACGEEMALLLWPEEQSEQVGRTLQAWAQGGPRLVILDNLEDVEAAREWLRRLRGCGAALLLTARRSDWPADLGLSPLRLRQLTKRDSLRFLRKYLPAERARTDDLNSLAERLGYLPLALELAGRYLSRLATLRVATYVEKLDEVLSHRSMQGWEEALGNPTGHDLDLMQTFALSWEELEGQAEARRVFAVAGYCAPNQPIPCGVLAAAAGLEEEECAEALARLTGLSLLEMDDPTASTTVHPLLAEFSRVLPGEDDEGFHPLDALTSALAPLAEAAVDTGLPSEFTVLRPHVEAVIAAAAESEAEDASWLLDRYATHLQMVTEYAGARAAFERALALDEAAYGSDHPTVASRLNNLGGVLRDQGDYEGAQAAYERALAIGEAVYGPDHPSVATAVNNLGSALHALGDFEGARAALERALAIDERVCGPDHPNVARDVNNLGSVLHALGDYAGARAAFEQAIKIWTDAYGGDHPLLATGTNNLGEVLRAVGDYEGAKAAYERALAIGEAAFGPVHPNVAIRVNNLGLVLHALGEYEGARAAFERALTIDEAAFGLYHPDVARDVNNLGLALHALGEYEGARTAFERALTIDEAAFGPDHPNLANRLNNLGAVLHALGEYEGVRLALERALAIWEQTLPPDHPRLRAVRENLAAVQGELDQQ